MIAQSRREQLEHRFAATIALLEKLLNPRFAWFGALLSGFCALAIVLAPRDPFIVGVIAVAYLILVAVWALRHRAAAREWRAEVRQHHTLVTVPPDHIATADLPSLLLDPDDAPDLDTLDRILKPRAGDHEPVAESMRHISRGAFAFMIVALPLSFLAVVAMVLVLLWVLGVTDIPLEVPFLCLLAAVPGVYLGHEMQQYLDLTHDLLDRELEQAHRTLAVLEPQSEPYTSGGVIQWNGSRHFIDPSRLPVKPRKERRFPSGWVAIAVALGAVLIFAISVVVGFVFGG